MPGKRMQLWLPLFETSLDNSAYARDLQRAQKEWHGEDRIWLIPKIEKTVYWYLDIGPFRFRECAIPSETLNALLVVHITEEGFFFPPIGQGLVPSWHGRLPRGLFREWLNMPGPSFVLGQKEFNILMPFVTGKEGPGERVEYRKTAIRMEPGPTLPIISLEEETNMVWFAWPPPGSDLPQPVSPEAESCDENGPFRWEEKPLEGLPTVTDKKGERAINVWLRWPKPFAEMFPLGGGMDLLFGQAKMKKCVEDLAAGSPEAAMEIATQASRFTARGWSTLERAYLLPMLEAQGSQEVLAEVEVRHDIAVNTLHELLRHEHYTRIFRQPIEILRVFGWLGYLWWELDNEVNGEGKYIPQCKICGRFLEGTRGKYYCGPGDNLECYRNRRARDKRRERARQLRRGEMVGGHCQ